MVLAYLAFQIVYWAISQLFRWLGLELSRLFTVQKESLHLSGLLGIRSSTTNLEVNPEGWNSLLRAFNAPVRVKCGGIDHIEIQFGWLLLGKISLQVRGLFLLTHVTNERYHDPSWEIKKALELKRFLVKKFEHLEGRDGPVVSNENTGFCSRLIIKIILCLLRKVEIYFDEVHIRIEDDVSLVNEKTSAGFSLRQFALREDNVLRQRHLKRNGSAKTINIEDISFYLNPHEEQIFSYLPLSESIEKLKTVPYVKTIGYCYVLKPSSILSSVLLASGKQYVLQLQFTLELKGICFQLSKEQIRVSSQSLGFLKHLQNTNIFLEHRPKQPIIGHAKQWWLYAQKCISMHLRRSKWDWLEVKEQSELRKKYATYYQEFLKKGAPRRLKKRLQLLEDEMSLLNILLVRRKVEEEVNKNLLKEEAERRKKKHLWVFYRRKWKNKPTWKNDKTQMAFYSLSGQFSITDIELSLIEDTNGNEFNKDIFTLQVCKSHVEVMKQNQMINMEVTLGDVKCVGVAKRNEDLQTRPDLLMWVESNEALPVLSVVLTTTDGSTKIKPATHYHHNIKCFLRPSVFIFDWKTAQCLAEFGSLLTSTHKDLKDAVKETVKQVGRESQLKLRYFIANKELASVTADLHLPLIVLTDTLGNECQHVAIKLGHLSVTTTEDQSEQKNKTCQIYNSVLKGIKILFQETDPAPRWYEWMSYLENTEAAMKDETIIGRVGTLSTVLMYNTYYSPSIPSNLCMDIHTPELYTSISDGQLDNLLQFCYGQLSSFYLAIATVHNMPLRTPGSEEVDSDTLKERSQLSGSTLQPLVSTVYHDLRRFTISHHPPLLARSVTELGLEGPNIGTESDDHIIFFCKVLIDKVVVNLKRRKKDWIKLFVSIEIQEIDVVDEWREQASRLIVQLSQVVIKCHTYIGRDGKPIQVLVTNKDFLQLKNTYANPKMPLFLSAYESIEEEHVVHINPFTLCLHREVFCDILSFFINLNLPPFKSLMGVATSNPAKNKHISLPSKFLPVSSLPLPVEGAIHMIHHLKIHEFTVAIATELANTVAMVTITDLSTLYVDKYDVGEFQGHINRISLIDKLITNSPYNLILSNLPDKQLINTELSWKCVDSYCKHFTGNINIGSLRAVYLHKMTTTIHLFVSELIHYWHEMFERVNMKLTAAVRTMKRSKRFPRQPLKPKPKLATSLIVYDIDIYFDQPSLLLPKDSYNPDTLRLSMNKFNVKCKSRPYYKKHSSSDVEETDGLSSGLSMKRDTQPRNEVTCNALAEMITINWMVGGQEKTILKIIKLSMSHSQIKPPFTSSLMATSPTPYRVTIPDLEITLTAESVATVPVIISSNFTEPEPLGLPYKSRTTSQEQIQFDHTSYLKSESPRYRKASTDTKSDESEDDLPPIIELVTDCWTWVLYHEEVQQSTIMTTIVFHKTNIGFGTNAANNKGVWFKGCIQDIIGVEGAYCDSYHSIRRILCRSMLSDKHHLSLQNRQRPLIDLMISRQNDGEIRVTTIMSTVCLCLWPNFINTLMKFIEQCKVKESKSTKWWKRKQSKRKSTLELLATPVTIIINKPTLEPPGTRGVKMKKKESIFESESTPKNAGTRFNLRMIFDECIIAVLENPVPQEITTPGMFFEFHSYRIGFSHAAVCDYTTTPTQWGITLSPCQLRASLCLHGEGIIPLNQVIPPSSIEFNYVSSDTLERVILLIPRMVVNFTNELRQVINNFYQNIDKLSGEKYKSTTTTVSNIDIWTIKDIDRNAILPMHVQEEATDFDEDELEEEEETVRKHQLPEIIDRQQEATIELSEFLVNFDLMCGGDSSSVMCVHTAARMELKQWENNLSMDLRLTLEAFIYNENLASWEPLIEPLEDIRIGGYRPYQVHAKMFRVYDALMVDPKEGVAPFSPATHSPTGSINLEQENKDKVPRDMNNSSLMETISQLSIISMTSEGHSMAKSKEDKKPAYIVICTSDDHLELSITPSAIHTIKDYIEAQNNDHFVAMSNIRSAIHDSRPPVRVDNKTGMNMFVYPGPTFQDGATQRKYNTSVLLPTHTMRHFPSIVETNETVDYMKRRRKLGTIMEDSDVVVAKADDSSIGGVPLYFQRRTTSLDFADDDEDSDSDMSITSRSVSPYPPPRDTIGQLTGEVPVIEGSMEDIGGGESGKKQKSSSKDKEETDSGVEEAKDEGKGTGRVRRRSVSRMRSMSSRHSDRVTSSLKLNYWRPKSLFKTHKIRLQIDDSNKSKSIKVSHPGVFVVPIHHTLYGWISVVCDVTIKQGVRKVTIHSGLQIKNELPVLVTVYTKNRPLSPAEKIGEIHRDKIFHVPLNVLAKQQELTFGVGSSGIACQESLNWRDMSSDKSIIMTCPENMLDGEEFYIRANIKPQPAINLTTYSPSHMITLGAPLVLQNHLPIPITVTLQATPTKATQPSEPYELEPGGEDQIYQFQLKGDIVIKIQFLYNELHWQGHCELHLGLPVMASCPLEGFNESGRSISIMYVSLCIDQENTALLHIYAPFWIVNKTGLDLEFEHQSGKGKSYKSVNKAVNNVPTLLTYHKAGKPDERQKVKLRVLEGDWSKSFVVGAVGKAYSASSKRGDHLYEFSVETQLLKSTLTEVVYILPKYSILNQTYVPLLCMSLGPDGEGRTQTAARLLPNELRPFWPGTFDCVGVSVGNVGPRSQKFSLSIVNSMVFPMEDKKLPVLTVKIQRDPLKGTAIIALLSYADTGALLQVENLCRELSIKFVQGMTSGSGQLYVLSPNQSVLYTWDSPAGKRELRWQVIGAQEMTWYPLILEQTKQNGSLSLRVVTDDDKGRSVVEEKICYWITMFEGSQLVLRFFDHKEDYDYLMELQQHKKSADLQIFCSLEGIGLSLVNNVPEEVAYCTIASSPTLWMIRRPKSDGVWSVVDRENSVLLETAWRTGETSCMIGDEQYDLDHMVIRSSKGGRLSRSFNPGIWVWYSQCEQRSSYSVKLGHMQIDNQLELIELQSRVVFSAKDQTHPDALEVAAPFIDFLTTVNTRDKNAVREVEKFFFKVKPSQLTIELGFVAGLVPFYDVLFTSDNEIVQFSKDEISQIKRPLQDIMKTDSLIKVRPVNHIDLLQIAQTSVLVGYTTAGEYDLSSQWGKVVNALIHFALITKGLFDITLKSVTISNETMDSEQIKRILWGHYKHEILWQFQRLALGLDVLGNPEKLLNSFETGAKVLVNYSRQGIADGEVGSGIACGVKGFLGHSIEGSSESVVRSAGTFSSVLLSATDIDYQRKHRHMRQRDLESDFSTNFKLGSTFFIKGVLYGATDIVVKPITGAATEGFEGFLKGLGRGAVSVLVKPTLGVVDLAKYTMEGIRSTVDDDFGLQTTRLPRFIHKDRVFAPYNSREGEGLYILRHLAEPIVNENYVFHEWLPTTKPSEDPLLIVVTSKNLMQLKKTRRHYRKEWCTGLDTIIRTEAMHFVIEGQKEEDPGLLLIYKEEGLFRKKEISLLLKLEDTLGAQVLEEKISAARKSLAKQHGGYI